MIQYRSTPDFCPKHVQTLLNAKLTNLKEFTNKDFIAQFASEYYKNADEQNKKDISDKEDTLSDQNCKQNEEAQNKDEPGSSIHKVVVGSQQDKDQENNKPSPKQTRK